MGILVRVREAAMVARGSAGLFVVSGLARPRLLADALAGAGATVDVAGDRLEITAPPALVVSVCGGVEPDIGAPLTRAFESALAGWSQPPRDVETPAGRLPTSQRPVVMGVVNATPDSFSDGGQHFRLGEHPQRAVAHGLRLVAEGADLIDVGGESTRPGAEPVHVDEELSRVVPVIEQLAERDVVVSVDTTKSQVAKLAVEAGAAVVNDVSAGAMDAEMIPTVAALGVPYVLMHMRGTPRTMQRDPEYQDVVAEVFEFLGARLAQLEKAGIAADRVIIDPGIGFGKGLEHNLELLRRIREFTSLSRAVMIGTSRKSFLGRITGADTADRLEGSLVTAAHAVSQGVSIVRVHDVAATVQAVRVAHRLRAR